tara:strand:+ start:2545 stop:3474 length:930 start_codon:yes stop_codon:yes gene_type:complete
MKNKNLTLGYACINMELRKDKIFTNRHMRQKTFEAKGIEYASELNLLNVKDLVKIIQWNIDNDIKLYRMSSDIFTWHSHYNLTDCPDYPEIKRHLEIAGKLARDNGIRLSAHPGQYTVLASPNEDIVVRAIDILDKTAIVMDLMGMPKTPECKINIHIGGTYDDKKATMARFCKNFKRIIPSAQARLTIENDDKASMYSVSDLYEGIYKVIGIPVVFDYHHHRFCTGGLSEAEALHLAAKTWPKDIRQCTHYSESMALMEGAEDKREQAHSNYIYNEINTHGLSIDCMVEAKMKEKAVQRYYDKHLVLS